jgi:hypothetical protein
LGPSFRSHRRRSDMRAVDEVGKGGRIPAGSCPEARGLFSDLDLPWLAGRGGSSIADNCLTMSCTSRSSKSRHAVGRSERTGLRRAVVRAPEPSRAIAGGRSCLPSATSFPTSRMRRVLPRHALLRRSRWTPRRNLRRCRAKA